MEESDLRGLIESGEWHNFGIILESDILKYRPLLEKRFESIILIPTKDFGNHSSNTLYRIYVQGFENIPDGANPRGGFIQVGILRKKEEISEGRLAQLREIIGQGWPYEVETVVMPGPAYERSDEVNGKFVRIQDARAIYMRWQIKD